MVVPRVGLTFYPKTPIDFPGHPFTPQETLYIVRKSFILFSMINYHDVISFLVYITFSCSRRCKFYNSYWTYIVNSTSPCHYSKLWIISFKLYWKNQRFPSRYTSFLYHFLSICYRKSDYKWSDMRNISICSILQYVLQYGSAVLQHIAICFSPYCFTPTKRTVFILDRVQSCGKTRQCWLPAFSAFPTIFSKAFLLKYIFEKENWESTNVTSTSKNYLQQEQDQYFYGNWLTLSQMKNFRLPNWKKTISDLMTIKNIVGNRDTARNQWFFIPHFQNGILSPLSDKSCQLWQF